MSKEAVLPAGTIVSYAVIDADGQVTGEYTAVPGITAIGAVGTTSEPKAKTTLANDRKVYGASLPDAPDKQVKGQFLSSDPAQVAFLNLCKAYAELSIKVVYPDKATSGGEGTTATYPMKTLGFELDDANPEEWMMFTVPGKQNDDTAWTASS